MSLKKQKFKDSEIPIFEDAVIYKRGDYWQFRMWLTKENRYARRSLRTRSETTAIEKGKECYFEIYGNTLQGKTYFSLTTKQGVEKYLEQRKKDLDARLIVKGRLGTIKTHLEHWLNFIKRDTKLKELERTDCENYFHERTKTKKNIAIRQSTIMNEQSSINAMMMWLYKNKETYIYGFDFKKLPRLDKKQFDLKRETFSKEEMGRIQDVLHNYIDEERAHLDDEKSLIKTLCAYYFLIAIISGLRTGEQKGLRWADIEFLEHKIEKEEVSLVKIKVRAETSKVRKYRDFYIRDREYFDALSKILMPLHKASNKHKVLAQNLIFSVDGVTVLSQRALLYHFDKLLTKAEIEDREKKDLVPYSFRHYFITDKIKSGLSFQQIADMCGTSATQVGNTYYHIDRDIQITNALADYYIDSNGKIIPR